VRDKTDAAFAEFRANFPAKPCNMALVANDDELIEMTPADGLQVWVDGSGTATKGKVPLIQPRPQNADLWVVRADEVVYAAERADFGKSLATGVIKHSNLTGGRDGHSGGELIMLEGGVIAVTGASGRYGPSTECEMRAVTEAFKKSGYGVWSYGFSDETATPYKFGDRDPEWIS
jgi:hypothetical protein